jgi:hypothetical protein
VIPKDFHFLSFDSSVTVLRSNRVVGFAWIGLALALWTVLMENKNHQHYSSQNITTIIVFEESHHFVNPGVKVSFLLIYHGLVKFCNGLALISLRLISQ